MTTENYPNIQLNLRFNEFKFEPSKQILLSPEGTTDEDIKGALFRDRVVWQTNFNVPLDLISIVRLRRENIKAVDARVVGALNIIYKIETSEFMFDLATSYLCYMTEEEKWVDVSIGDDTNFVTVDILKKKEQDIVYVQPLYNNINNLNLSLVGVSLSQ